MDKVTDFAYPLSRNRVVFQKHVGFPDGIRKQLNFGIGLLAITITTDQMAFHFLKDLIEIRCIRPIQPRLEA